MRSDLSVRVIAKAEAGQVVSPKTVEAIGRALCHAGQAVQSADLTCNPDALARKFLKSYAVHQADCVQHCLDFVSPDIVAYVDGDSATNPIAGEYCGIEEFDGLWQKFFTMFVRDGGSLGDNPETRCIGNEVLAWGHEYIHIPEVAPKEPGFVMLRLRFEGGWMVRFEDYYEATGMMHALNHFAPQFPDANWAKLLREKVLATSSVPPEELS